MEEAPMPHAPKDTRHPAPGLIDQRQGQIDPARRHTADPDQRPDANRKQPGGADPAKARQDARKARASDAGTKGRREVVPR
jgi:hypothetical protein